MNATVEITVPEALLRFLRITPAELSKQALNALILESYRSGQLSHAQVGEALGLDRWQTDAFLKQANAQPAAQAEEIEEDFATLKEFLAR